jgi:hypothetical protein
MGNSIIEDYQYCQIEYGCECCRSKQNYTVTTSTYEPHKWTKEEIETSIIEISKELVTCNWFQRGNVRYKLKHWVEKLERFNEAKENFNL